ncbi:hypothetical protein BSKO_00607 [Bryopsis sp. KO-2023]|nr:hypothetical protein BSKO_00607 [Bryopsis sp. KO-2023]
MCSNRVARVAQKELKELQDKPCEGIRVTLNEDCVTEVVVELDGPDGTPYEGGLFKFKLSLCQEYPAKPPKGWFLTKIFHPNISKTGEICVNVLQKDWNASLGLRHVLLVIRCLMIEPFAESALNDEAGKLLLEDYQEYAKVAKLMTDIHAAQTVAKRPMPQENCSGSANVESGTGESSSGVERERDATSSPVHKKAKGETRQNSRPSGARRGLRRL